MGMSIGVEKFFDDIKNYRYRFRQFVGIFFIVFVSLLAKPVPETFFAGSLLVVAGIAIRMWASGHIKKNSELATDGPYAYVRHPLYVGNITLGLGFALSSGLWWAIPVYVLILIVFYPQAIRNEDEKLHAMFRDEWEKWSRNTKALIPRFIILKPEQRGTWSFKQSLMSNGEPVIAVFLFACLLLQYSVLR